MWLGVVVFAEKGLLGNQLILKGFCLMTIWPPILKTYIQSQLRCCGSDVVAIWQVVLSSAAFAVCSESEPKDCMCD